MAGEIKQYDPLNHIIIWGPLQIQGGWMDGSYLKAERNSDSFETAVGAGGEVARVRVRDASGKVTFTLMQTSVLNALLAAQMKADELAGTGVYPLLIKDLGGTLVCSAPNAWLTRPANVERAKELSGAEWVLECDQLTIVH